LGANGSSGDEAEELSVEVLGGIRGQKLVDGKISQLTVSLDNIGIPIEDDLGAALISREDKNIGLVHRK
jgi:hypothetical protein